MSEPPLNRNKEAMSTDPQPIQTDSTKKGAGGTEETEDLSVCLCHSTDTAYGLQCFHQSFTRNILNELQPYFIYNIYLTYIPFCKSVSCSDANFKQFL